MSQTTEQPASRSKRAISRKSPGSASTYRADLPSPPKRRRPAMTALAVLLIVGGAALAGLLALRMDARKEVLVVNASVPVGTRLSESMLASTRVASDKGVNLISASSLEAATGYYVTQTLYPGQLLTREVLSKTGPIGSDQATVGVPLAAGKYPPGLTSGDQIRLLRIGDGQDASEPIAIGLVLRVSRATSGGLGGSSSTSVATVLVPQSSADAVVGAAGANVLGLALLQRGVPLGDAQIRNLGGN